MKHLLIIEDDKIDQLAFERFVKQHEFPFTYQLVNSIAKAAKALRNQLFDGVISDFFLGDGTAFEIIALKTDIPIIIVTGTGSEELAVDALKKGAFDYIIKDVDGHYLTMLSITMQNAILRFQNQQELKKHQVNLEKMVKSRTTKLNKEITIRKKAESELKKLSIAVEQNPSAIIISDLNGKIEYVNPQFTKITGYTYAEALGESTNILKSGTQSSSFYKNLWETIEAGKKWHGEFHNKKKSGDLFWESASISPILNEENKTINYIKISEDITLHKKVNDEIKKTYEEYKKIKKQASSLQKKSLIKLLITVSTFVFFLEYFIMDYLEYLPDYLLKYEHLLDSFTISILIIPLVYFIAIRPQNIFRIFEGQKLKQDQESELNNRLIIDQLQDGLFTTSMDGYINFVNPKLCELLKYRSEEIIGKLKPDTFMEATSKAIYEEKKAFIIKGLNIQFEIQMKKKTGELFWVSINKSPSYNLEGTIIGSITTLHDITQRKENSLRIKESELNLQSAQKMAKIGSFNVDLRTQLSTCSKMFFSITELNVVAHQSFAEWRTLIHPDDLEVNKTVFKAFLKNGTYNHTYRIITKVSKQVKWIHGLGELILDTTGNPQFFKGTLQDITERKRDEQIQQTLFEISNNLNKNLSLIELLKLIQLKLGTIMDTTNFYVALLNEDTNTIVVPYKSDEKDAITSLPSKNTLTEYIIKLGKPLLATKKELEKIIKSEKLNVLGTLSEVWLGVPLKNENKSFGTLAVQSYTNSNAYTNDDKKILEFVSDQISLSIHRKHVEENLEKAYVKAQESDKLKTAFLHNISHEIRTPMNGILGFSELLQKEDLTVEKQKKYTSIISKSGKRLLNTLNDLMDISKLETGQVVLANSSININEELTNLYEFYTPEVKSKGLAFEITLENPQGMVLLENDKGKFNAIISNLIKNAIKYSNEGIINFGYTLKNNLIQFFVSDNGIGIPKNRQEAIFDRFVQADIEDRNVFEGAGLGLSIVKSYLEMMQGEIWVTSELGKGSTFYFTLPYQPTEEKKDKNKTKKVDAITSNTKLKILIAEDELYAYEYLSIIVSDMSSEIFHANNGLEALEIFKNNPTIDLILMDIKMPIMSGYDAIKEIRKINKDVKIIAQTAFSFPQDKEKTLLAGCNGYLSKPILKSDLENLINSLISKNNE